MDIKQYIDEIMPTLTNWEGPIRAEDLRKNIEQKSNKNNYPGILQHGIYKWWAPEDDIKELLGDNLPVNWEEFKKTELEKLPDDEKTPYYCIYVGVTTKQTLKTRLSNHLNHYRASSLRRTIMKFKKISIDEETEDIINEVINNFYVTYCPCDNQVYIALCEIAEINNYARILNQKDNYKWDIQKKQLLKQSNSE